jgi:hypothetical protein
MLLIVSFAVFALNGGGTILFNPAYLILNLYLIYLYKYIGFLYIYTCIKLINKLIAFNPKITKFMKDMSILLRFCLSVESKHPIV